MIRRHARLLAAALAGSLLVPAAVVAQDPLGRFQMAPVEGGMLRLDTVTGAVSHCSGADGKWRCQSAEDDMRTMHVEIDRLISENRKLMADIAQLRANEPVPGDKGGRSGPSLSLPSEQDVDKALDTMERLIRKFQDRFKSLDKPRPPATPL